MILTDLSGKVVRINEGIREEEILIYRRGLSPGCYYLKLTGKKLYRGTLIIK